MVDAEISIKDTEAFQSLLKDFSMSLELLGEAEKTAPAPLVDRIKKFAESLGERYQ